ncbi:MAG: CopG family transcriptional regulator, partial [Candidatus Caldatribacteriaceae bacterium]
MEYQNITLAIPREILRRAKRIATERGISLSGLLTQLLTEYALGEEEYRKARRNHMAMMGKFDLGTSGNPVTQSREILH